MVSVGGADMVARLTIIVLCACFSLGGQAHGATFGNTSGAFSTSIENRVVLSRFALSEDGVADSITAHINNTFATKSIRYVLFRVAATAGDDSLRLVAWTDATSVGTGDQWKGIAFNPKPLLRSGAYYIGAWSSSGSGNNNIYYAVTSGEKKAHRNLGSYDSTAFYNLSSFTLDADSVNAIYCTYTASTDGVMGDTLLGQSGLSCEGTINGGVWQTPAKDIIIDSAAWWVDLGVHSATSHFRAMGAGLYLEADSSLLDYSDSTSVQLNGNGDRMRVFEFNNKPTISASTNIFPSFWSDTSYGTIQTRVVTLSGGGLYTRSYSWKNNGPGTWPDPMGAAKAANYKVHCLLYYHDAPAGGGIPPRRRKIILGQPLGLVTEAKETFAGSDDAIPD